MRYTATFDSERPEHGVIIDDERGRYCTWPSLEKAQETAERWNQLPPDADPPVIWRCTTTGERIEDVHEPSYALGYQHGWHNCTEVAKAENTMHLVGRIRLLVSDLDIAREDGTVYTYGQIQQRLRGMLSDHTDGGTT